MANNFTSDGDFKIELQAAQASAMPLSFYTYNSSLKIQKGVTSGLKMSFLPFSLDTQKCFVIFKDPSVGEFQYEITGIVNKPEAFQDTLRIRQVLYTNKKYSIDLPIPLKNESILKARKISELLNDSKHERERDRKNLHRSPITDRNFFPKLSPKDTYIGKITPANEMVILKGG